MGKVWRDRAQWVVRGVGPPTVPIGLPGHDDEVTQRHARMVIDLALRIGEAMLSTGASAADVVTNVLRVMTSYDIRQAHIDITFTSIEVSINRGVDEDPLTVMRVVSVRSPDYSRLQRVQDLVSRIVEPDGLEDRMLVQEARQELGKVLAQPHPYRRWVVTAGFALLAAAVTALFGAQPGMWLVAAISATVVDRVTRALARFGVAAFFNQAIGAAIPTTIAVLLSWAMDQGINVAGVQSPSLVVISGIIVLLAGLTVVGAAEDALDGYYVTAGARGLEVLILTAGIATGISVVLAIAGAFEVPMEVVPTVRVDGSAVTNTFAAVLVGIGFAMSTYTGFRGIVVAAAAAGTGWVAYELMALLGFGNAMTVGVAAAVVGAFGYAAHRTFRVPELAITTAGIVSLLPGLAVYRALFWMMEDSAGLVSTAMVEGFRAVSIALGLAAGVSIGGFAARHAFGLDRAAVRARRRARGSFS
ncbi:threonine/serine exporter family protein [Ornithinicoccus hortensis]